ncbi:hypothetical protein [Halomonas binhaiensis]|uniref:Uncharacterized protein n=1 Tax=Halomonas binhaiensis TaxID=2562282 RepID=A0A5C1NG93_9GAMM|nr:hypothetical protein [Halomonas binhaiensis]QEM82266.1 hypothetical protein E4T21_12455 [Halomonas binhaiensis]
MGTEPISRSHMNMKFDSVLNLSSWNKAVSRSKDDQDSLDTTKELGTHESGNDNPATDHHKDIIDALDDIREGGLGRETGLDNNDQIEFERDVRRNEEDESSDKPEDQNVIQRTVEDLLESDPEFEEAFNDALDKGIRLQFRFNADENRTTLINGDVLQIDIRNDADVKDELKNVFNEDSNWEPEKPGEGPSFEEVMADSDMSGEDFVAHLERLNIFSFSGQHGDKIRKDVIYMYDHSDFMKETIRSTLENTDGQKKFNFSAIGHGGGTITNPFDDFATSVNAPTAYDDISTKDYKSEDNLNNVSLMAHEMVHSFLGIGDTPTMDIAEEIFANELGAPDAGLGPAGGLGGVTRIGYDEDRLGATIDLDDDFDVEDFMEQARGGDLDQMTHEEIMDEFGGGEIGLPAIEDDEELDDKLNGLVETIRSGVDVKDRHTLYMEGGLADRYQQLLDYNLRHGDFDSPQELSKFTKDQFMDRLGNFEDEADVFAGYLERHGGNEQLDNLAYQTWGSGKDLDVTPEQDLFEDATDFDNHLNGIVSTIVDGVDVEGRKTLYMEGNLADRYKQLLEYNLIHGDFASYEELSHHTGKQLMDRLGNFSDEADVFNGYLVRHGGIEQLTDLARQVWVDAGLDPKAS